MALTTIGDNLKELFSIDLDINALYSVEEFRLNKGSSQLNLSNLFGGSDIERAVTIKAVEVSTITFSEIRSWIGGTWAYTPGTHELQQVDITIRDRNGGQIYANFVAMMKDLRQRYPANQQWTLKIRKFPSSIYNHLSGGDSNSKGNIIVDTNCAIIRNIGSITLDTEDTAYSTFVVSMFFDPYPFVTGETTSIGGF